MYRHSDGVTMLCFQLFLFSQCCEVLFKLLVRHDTNFSHQLKLSVINNIFTQVLHILSKQHLNFSESS